MTIRSRQPSGCGLNPPSAARASSTPFERWDLMPPAHYRAVEETVRQTLGQGLHGWEVVDAAVTLTDARTIQYASPTSTAGDFRKLTPLVVMQAAGGGGDRGLRANRSA